MSRSYKIKEIFYTIQGEGAQTGRPAVFVRFSGCNLWSGREEDRHKAICPFCDTDFHGTDGERGGTYSARQLAQVVLDVWAERHGDPFIVITGGEPLLQVDEALINELHTRHIEIAIETNGTIRVPDEIDWICVSPKAGTQLVQRHGHELKVVYPQVGIDPLDYSDLDFRYFSIQPMDGPHREENTSEAIAFCLAHPQWRLSLQTHKVLGLP
jgi:7-carboxy-7-deazaguanine synthase